MHSVCLFKTPLCHFVTYWQTQGVREPIWLTFSFWIKCQHKKVPSRYVVAKGFDILYPCAACTRKMYVKASDASAVAFDLEEESAWEEYTDGTQRDAVIEV